MINQEAFLKGFKRLIIPIVDDKGRPAWPEMFPLSRIEKIRDTVGPRHFASQMMLVPAGLERARLDANAIHFYSDELDLKAARLGENPLTGWALYWDPSVAHKRNDSSVCVFVLLDGRKRRAFIHDCIYLAAEDDDPHPLKTQCRTILDFMNSIGISRISIEVNGLGNALPEILQDEARIRGDAVFVERIVNSKNKQERILDAIEPLLGTGRLYANDKIRGSALISEMEDWSPNGWTHDDGLDALAGALRLQPVPLRPRGQTIWPISAKTDFKI